MVEKAELGQHVFLGGKGEGNGLIHTRRGGFVDIGHLREWADWTGFLYNKIKMADKARSIKLGTEGGMRVLELKNLEGLDDNDRIILAGRIAFDLSTWHEIATGYGVSVAPIVNEKFSSFSPEDTYSNLLGVALGMAAIKSDLPYEEAMTVLIGEVLDTLLADTILEQTYEAMEIVESEWWSRVWKLPNRKITLKRRYIEDWCILPLRLNENDTIAPFELEIPIAFGSGKPLSDYYRVTVKLNHKFPLRKVLPEKSNRLVSQDDFEVLTDYIKPKLTSYEQKGRPKVRADLSERKRYSLLHRQK